MEFRFHCFVTRHVSDRVTVTPLELPHLAVHSASLERATEDLTLAIDDRIHRAHPRHVSDYARPGGGEVLELTVPQILPVWDAAGSLARPVCVTVVLAPGHRPFIEVRAPRLDLRLWLTAGDDLVARATVLVQAHLETLDERARLALRREGAESLVELVVSATPPRLAQLKRRELALDERPPPRRRDAADDDDDDGGGRASDDDDDDEADDAAAAARRDDGDDDEADDGARRASGPRRARDRRVPTPTLRRLGVALHELARADALARAYEMDALVERLAQRLAARAPEPLVLVGPHGVGKTAALHELARRLAAAEGRDAADARAFFYLDASRLIAGEGFFGDWQQQTLGALDEARRAGAVLHLGHVVELLDAGKSAHSDQNVAQLLAPVLAAREVAVVGEATAEEWTRLERRSQSFAQVWSVLRIDEPPPPTAGRVLARVAADVGREKGVAVDPAAVETAAALARRYWPYGSLVGNAVAFVRRLIDARAHARATRVSAHDAIALFSSESGLPPALVRDDVPLDAAAVRAFLRSRVVAQEAAVERVAEVVAVIKAGLSDLRRPVSVLFFAGPTGVGKTELSKALAEFVFGARERMVRLDMGEYAGPDGLARLIGTGATPGHLTAAVRRQPFCVVLLDEIEKAHPAVFDALLAVLGEARLTDGAGRFTDFRNAVIVMTSNLGADTLRARVGFGPSGADADARAAADARRHYVGEAERFFRPELFNRIDDFVVFAPLAPDALRTIVRREVGLLTRREGFRRHNLALEISDAALDLLAARGFDPRYGARPLKRAIERDLVAPIGAYLAAHPAPGATRLTAAVEPPGRLVLRAAAAPAAAQDAAARAVVHEVLVEAAELRAEVRRWSRSPLAAALRADLAYVERASKQPGFWRERALAERANQKLAVAREVLEGLARVARAADAAEDLSFEAYYDRATEEAATLRVELAATRGAFEPLKERLYATLYPPRGGVLLYLVPARGAWPWLDWLLKGYEGFCASRGLDARVFAARFAEPGRRPDAPPSAPGATWKWEPWDRRATPAPTPAPAAVALAVTAGAAATLLAAEHGAHRFHDGSATAVVRVRVEPGHGTHDAPQLADAAALAKALPDGEIRKVAPHRNSLKDLRTGTDHAQGTEGFDPAPVLAAYVRHRVFGGEAEPWS